jgi:hypothetical protein
MTMLALRRGMHVNGAARIDNPDEYGSIIKVYIPALSQVQRL